jgi:hypothetical protein
MNYHEIALDAFIKDEFPNEDIKTNIGWSEEDGKIASKIYGKGIYTTYHIDEDNSLMDDEFTPFK